jgi:hypothetical protein
MGFSPMTLATALYAAHKFAGDYTLVPQPHPGSRLQSRFVNLLPDYLQALPFYDEYVSGIAAETAVEINRFLAEHGFDIHLHDWPNNGRNFGVAGVSDILDHWVNPGQLVPITGADQTYEGFALSGDQWCDVVEPPLWFTNPVVRVSTKKGLDVRFVMCDEPKDQIHLAHLARGLHTYNPGFRYTGHNGAHVPMVNLNTEPDVSWLINLGLSGPLGAWIIQQAKMQVKLAMNEKGFRAEEASAMGMDEMCFGSTAEPLVLNRPFLMTAGKPDVPVPVFFAYISPDDWDDPSEL